MREDVDELREKYDESFDSLEEKIETTINSTDTGYNLNNCKKAITLGVLVGIVVALSLSIFLESVTFTGSLASWIIALFAGLVTTRVR